MPLTNAASVMTTPKPQNSWARRFKDSNQPKLRRPPVSCPDGSPAFSHKDTVIFSRNLIDDGLQEGSIPLVCRLSFSRSWRAENLSRLVVASKRQPINLRMEQNCALSQDR